MVADRNNRINRKWI